MQNGKFMQYLLLLMLLLYGQVPAQTGWEWQNPLPQGNLLRSVELFDSANAVIVGGGGSIMKTTNNGLTWLSQFNV